MLCFCGSLNLVGGFLFLQEVAVAADDWKMVQSLNFNNCVVFFGVLGEIGKKNCDFDW